MVFIILALSVAGCGYTLRRSQPVESVRLGMIENMTYEPKLDDMILEALAVELSKKGIRVDEGSQYVIAGNIHEFRLRGIVEKKDVTVQYEVIMNGSFELVGPDGTRKSLKSSNVFMVNFGGEGELNTLLNMKDMALRAAASNIASEIVASIIYAR